MVASQSSLIFIFIDFLLKTGTHMIGHTAVELIAEVNPYRPIFQLDIPRCEDSAYGDLHLLSYLLNM
jgi:hypothetical protein